MLSYCNRAKLINRIVIEPHTTQKFPRRFYFLIVSPTSINTLVLFTAADMTTSIKLPRPAADFHVHVRDGDMMKLVVPTIKQGGVSVAYIMVLCYSQLSL